MRERDDKRYKERRKLAKQIDKNLFPYILVEKCNELNVKKIFIIVFRIQSTLLVLSHPSS